MYEWDEDKRLTNIEKHAIDFVRAKEIWTGPVLEIQSPQSEHGEERILAIGMVDDRCITVVYTWRGDNRRLISARKARKDEQAHYENEIG
ncbi:MAG TPA: BrnT family toxin [Verrucomicrobiales bacterium]|nr:BrnT family toxin [Verrucomicrobiales bacterium]